MPAHDAPDIAPSKMLGVEEQERRAQVLRSDDPLCAGLITVFESTQEPRQPSVHVEERIYDGFVQAADEAGMERFHKVPWEMRVAIPPYSS